MENTSAISLHELSDADLTARVKSLAGRERDATAQLIAHLAELGRRDLHLAAGYGSLFAYCMGALALSEHEAYLRIEAAKLSRRFPVILELLAEGAINLTTLKLLGPHLTDDNHQALLASAGGKRKREVEEIVAALAPQPDVPPKIRKLPEPAPPKPAAAERSQGAAEPSRPAPTPKAPPPPKPVTTTPLAPERYKLQMTIGAETLEKLKLAKDMLSHAIPSGDEAQILDRALTLLLVDLARQKFAATEKPRPGRQTAEDPRDMPAEVKRAVWVRDLGRCTFVGTNGHRCNERRFIEFDHKTPWAANGKPTLGNARLLCRQHNQYASKLFFAREDDGRGLAGEGSVRYFAVQAASGQTRSRTRPAGRIRGACSTA
jgi:hypothetical protein